MNVPLAPRKSKKSKENLDETTYDDLEEVSRNLWAPRPKWCVEEGEKFPVKKEPGWGKMKPPYWSEFKREFLAEREQSDG